ncbi:hypothetical protein [Thermomonospora amylolytica]|uniref:hypothetical protein n=1 Tax=Thermomonospora amylolytica TaxID=1411117 RepID=UPI0013003926|nr:hypothetical protein [Thermomonospora amylolytica]
MKTAMRRAGLLRYLGYGGSLLLVLAALVVLALPLFDRTGGAGTAGGRTSGGAHPAAPQGTGPAVATDDPARTDGGQGGTGATGTGPLDRPQAGGAGDPLAQAGGRTPRYCPAAWAPCGTP